MIVMNVFLLQDDDKCQAWEIHNITQHHNYYYAQ